MSDAPQPRPAKSGLMIVFVTVFIDLLGFGIVLPLLPRYGKAFNADNITLGLLMASFSAMQFIFAPIWGRVSDRVGRRPILILGLAGSTEFYALFGFATHIGADQETLLGLAVLPWLFITRIGQGIAGATIPTAQAYIADVTGAHERGKGMALIGAAFGIGFTFGPLIGAMFVSVEGGVHPSPYPGYVASALSGIAMLCAVFLLPESLKKERSAGESLKFAEPRHVDPNRPAADERPCPMCGEEIPVIALQCPHCGELLREPQLPMDSHWFALRRLRGALEVRGVGLILLTMFLTTFAFAQFESTLALLTEKLGMADRDNFFVFAYIGFILTLSQGVLVRRLIPRLGEFKMGLIGTLLMTVGLLSIGWAGNSGSRGLLFSVLPIAVVGFSALTPSLASLLSLRTTESEQGGILGVGQSITAMARIVGPAVGIPLFGLGMSVPYWSGAALMAVGVLLVLSLHSVAERKTPVESSQETV